MDYSILYTYCCILYTYLSVVLREKPTGRKKRQGVALWNYMHHQKHFIYIHIIETTAV